MRIAIVLFGLLTVLCCNEWCGNEIMETIPSPDGAYKIVIFRRNCGVMTGQSIQISILRSDDDDPTEAGNVLITDQKAAGAVFAEWTSDRGNTHRHQRRRGNVPKAR